MRTGPGGACATADTARRSSLGNGREVEVVPPAPADRVVYSASSSSTSRMLCHRRTAGRGRVRPALRTARSSWRRSTIRTDAIRRRVPPAGPSERDIVGVPHEPPGRRGSRPRLRAAGLRGPGCSSNPPSGGCAQAATAASSEPRSVVEVAPSIRTSTRLPASADPAKLTVVFRRVRPRRSAGSVRLAPSTSTCSTRPTRSSFRSRAIRWTTSTRRSMRSRLTSSGTWPVHRGRLCACTRRVDERERAVVAHLLDHLEGLTEVLFRLAGKADDDVGGQGQIGDGGAHLLDEAQVALPPVGAAHRLQDARRAGLERQVGVLTDGLALGHGGDDIRAEVLGMRAREADALDAVDGVHGAQKLGEVGADVAPVGIDVLAEQSDLPDPLLGKALDLGQHFNCRPADLAAAHRWDDAVRANGVAPHRDLHPRLHRPLAVRGQLCRERALVTGSEASARHAHSPGADPIAKMRDRSRPEGDVDERVLLEDSFPLGFRIAAADGDHPLGIALLENARVPEVRREPRVGFLADRARVEDEDVRVLRLGRLPQSQLLEQALDPLRVVGVHLASERGDVVALHCEDGSRVPVETDKSRELRKLAQRVADALRPDGVEILRSSMR